MRREERHHLKENPLAVLLADLQRSFIDRGRVVIIGVIVAVVALLAVGGFVAWEQRQTQKAGDLLAEAMVVMNAEVVPPPAPEDDSSSPPEPTPFEQPAGSYPTLHVEVRGGAPQTIGRRRRIPSDRAGDYGPV